MPPDHYSRLYWRFPDEFPTIYANDAAYALWCRLLPLADMAWPSSATLPMGVRKRALSMLVEAELVYLQPGTRYRLRGLDKERERRAEPARRSANARWDRMREQAALDAAADSEPPGAHSERTTDAMRTHSDRNAGAMLDETRRDETSRDETRRALSAREGLPHITPQVQEVGERIAGHGILSAGDKQLTELDRLCEDHGPEAVCGAMQAVAQTGQRSWRQLIWGATKHLEPLTNGRISEDDEVARLSEQTKREYAEYKRQQEASRA